MPLDDFLLAPPRLAGLFVAAGVVLGWLLSSAIRLLLISDDRIRYLLDE